MIQACPTDLVCATVDRIWELLTVPRELEQWSGTRVIEAPARPLDTGDRLVLGAGLGKKIRVSLMSFHVVEAKPPQELRLEIGLPFGITNHEVIRITPVGSRECRVTYN